ncbi:nitrilase-related carbon-nitrogen hydrolase [Desulfurobacterium atlanticum]|uniref:Predicted amidohydrolase n=1 Tax=Desulfurobacterium atlanticum TaxID=240169 RepID=A0A238Y6C1_9BACT|nr:nitrilase-related carbon-nitrogen hydrolase [Desulfurobacterium atlanticum]SNR66193.1 Predicted amidohydrolase [Desulfurobacterium atlanticum]
MKIAAVQINTVLGELEKNIEKICGFVEKCIERGVSVCIFPELSLTGYYLQDITSEIAITPDDERLAPLKRLSHHIGIIVGGIEESQEHILYNSAFYIEGGVVRFVHRKVYLPTYGMFDEARFVGAGDRFETFVTNGFKSTVLICEDCWHFSSLYIPFLKGAKLIFAQSASPGRGYKDKGMFGNTEVWKNMGEFYSRLTGSYFIYSNRVGVEDGFVFSGNSFICDPYGNVVAEGSTFGEEIVIADIEESLIRSARINLPLLRDEKPHILQRELDKFLKGN